MSSNLKNSNQHERHEPEEQRNNYGEYHYERLLLALRYVEEEVERVPAPLMKVVATIAHGSQSRA